MHEQDIAKRKQFADSEAIQKAGPIFRQLAAPRILSILKLNLLDNEAVLSCSNLLTVLDRLPYWQSVIHDAARALSAVKESRNGLRLDAKLRDAIKDSSAELSALSDKLKAEEKAVFLMSKDSKCYKF